MFWAKTCPRPDATTLFGVISPPIVSRSSRVPSEFGIGGEVVVEVDVGASVEVRDPPAATPAVDPSVESSGARATLTATNVAAIRVARTIRRIS